MRIAVRQQKCITIIVIAMMAWITFAEDPPGRAASPARRGESIVFSGAATDFTSTNLTLNNPKSSLKSLEADIKKPFDFFDRENLLPANRPLPVIRQQQMIERTKRSQELMRRKEDAYFDVGDDKDKDKEEDPYSLDPEKRKLRSPLERYYERVDRERSAVTNQFKSRDLFGDRKQKDGEEDVFSVFLGNKSAGDNPQVSARTARHMSNNPSSGSLFRTESTKPRTVDELLGATLPTGVEQDKARESRLDAFKKLIGVDTYASPRPPVNSLFSPTPAPASQTRPASVYSITAPSSYFPSTALPSTPVPGSSVYSSKSYSSWQVGQSHDNMPSLTPAPAPFQQPKPKTPTPGFDIPQRKF